MMYCSNCGTQQNNTNGVYCYNCGAKLGSGQGITDERPVSVKKRIVLSKKGEAVRSQLIKEGVGAALFVGCVTASLATLSLFNVSVLGSSPSMFIDAGTFLLLAYGISRGKGYAGVLAFTLYITEALYGAAVAGHSNLGGDFAVDLAGTVGLVVRIVLMRNFYRGMKGTLAYSESFSFATQRGNKSRPLMGLTIGCVVIGVVVALVLYGVTYSSAGS